MRPKDHKLMKLKLNYGVERKLRVLRRRCDVVVKENTGEDDQFIS